MQGLDVVDQRRAAENADLRHERRTMAGQAALAFDRLNHRGLFPADVGTGTPAQIDIARLDQSGVFERFDFLGEDFQHRRVFVAHVDEGGFRFHRPSGDQHALEEQVRGAFEVVAILEGSRFALIPVDSEVARSGLGADEGPLAARGEAGAAQPAQAGFQHTVLHSLRVHGSTAQGEQLFVAAIGAVGVEALVVGHAMMGVACGDRRLHALGRGVVDVIVAQLAGRRGIAAPHAGRAHDPHLIRRELALQRGLESLRTGEFAGQTVTDANGQRGRRGFVFADDVEVRVEGRDLVDFSLRQAHFLGQRAQMASGEVAEVVLQQVHVLDQQIGATGPRSEQPAYVLEGSVIDLATLGRPAALAFAGFPCAVGLIKRSHDVFPRGIFGRRLLPAPGCEQSESRH